MAHVVPDRHQALLGRKGPESLGGVLKVWSGDREQLGSDRQVVLQGSASYVRDKGGPVERMVGKHRAWRERLEHSLDLVSAAAAPGPAPLFQSADKPEICAVP